MKAGGALIQLSWPVKPMAVAVIASVLALSFIIYFAVQNTAEEKIRSALFEQQQVRQIQFAKLVAQNMESDLDSLMGRLRTIQISETIQKGDYTSANADRLLQQMYDEVNKVTQVDGLYILDENDIVVNYVNPSIRQQSFIGYDSSSLPSVIEYLANLPSATFSTAYQSIVDGTLRISLSYPIYNLESGRYMGAVTMALVLDSFLEHYGNLDDGNSQYLAMLDRNGIIMTSALKDLIGKNVFGDYVQSTNTDKSSNAHYEKVMNGTQSVAVFNFRTGEQINVGVPILLGGGEKPTYSLFIVTPTAAIYSEMESVISVQKTEIYLLLVGIAVAIAISIIFLVKWSGTVEKAVKEKTKDLKNSNLRLEAYSNQLEIANEKLHLHDKLQREFINVAAHELRTPVQPILGVMGMYDIDPVLLKAEGEDEEEEEIGVKKRHLRLVGRNAARLARLSSDILDASKIESNALKLRIDMNVNLIELITDAIEDAKKQVQDNNNIEFVTDLPKKVKVDVDSHRITQVLANLLDNAIRFTTKGTISVKAEKIDSSGGSGDEIRVTVSDTGKGLDPEVIPRLFQKFSSKTDAGNGTGLGLYISRAIIEAHGGRIWADNSQEVKEGATFVFTLPSAKS